MHKVKLVTSDYQAVANIEIPEFQPRYEILMWGSRFFKYHSMMSDPTDDKKIGYIIYKEASCYVVVGQEPGVKDGGD
jgi:hypothetical protein